MSESRSSVRGGLDVKESFRFMEDLAFPSFPNNSLRSSFGVLVKGDNLSLACQEKKETVKNMELGNSIKVKDSLKFAESCDERGQTVAKILFFAGSAINCIKSIVIGNTNVYLQVVFVLGCNCVFSMDPRVKKGYSLTITL